MANINLDFTDEQMEKFVKQHKYYPKKIKCFRSYPIYHNNSECEMIDLVIYEQEFFTPTKGKNEPYDYNLMLSFTLCPTFTSLLKEKLLEI